MATGDQFIPQTEDLKHIGDLKEFAPPPASAQQSPDVSPEREDILDFGDEGFLLSGVFSKEECRYYIEKGEQSGFLQIPGAKQSYRNSQRITFQCPDLASGLWVRIQPFLSDITIQGDPHDKHIHGVSTLLQGTWSPIRLNPVFRLCRYESGGHFAPHFDGHLVHSSQERSLQTFMMYLNGPPDFEGGATRFVDERQTLYMDEHGRYCAEEKNVLHSVEPAAGLGIIFNHHRLHEGQPLKSGVKYILRTEIMFERQGEVTIDPTEEKAFQLVQQAERLEAQGDNMEAMELYRKAFKLSPSLAQAYGN